MKYRLIATLSALLIFVNAFLFLLFPDASLGLLGQELSLAGVWVTRLSGACALGLGILLWQSRSLVDDQVQRKLKFDFVGIFLLIAVVDFFGILTDAVNQVGWIIFIADILLAIGFLSSIFTGTMKK